MKLKALLCVLLLAAPVWAACPTTTNLTLNQCPFGEANWDDDVNANFGVLDDAVLHTGTKLTSGRVPYATTGGEVKDEAAFAYNETTDTLSLGALSLTTPLADASVADVLTLNLESSTLTNLLDDELLVGTGAGTGAFKAVPDCDDSAGQHLNYDTTTNAFSCGTSSGGANLPVVDTTSIVEGSADATKEIRFEVDGLTTGTVRVLTPQNANYTLAGTNIAQSLTAELTVDGTEIDMESGGAEGFLRLPQSTTAPTGECDAAGESGRLYWDTDDDTDGALFGCRGAAGWKVLGGGGGGTPGGANTQIQFNDTTFGGDADFTWDKTNNTLTIGTNGEIINAVGAVGSPSYSFTGDTNTGLYWQSADTVGFVAGGVAAGRWTFDTFTWGRNNAATQKLYINNSSASGHALLHVGADGTSGDAYLEFDVDSNTTNWAVGIDNSASDQFSVSRSATPGTNEKLALDNTSTAGDTALLIWDVDNAALERVTVGAADSCGTNFKCLRIPN